MKLLISVFRHRFAVMASFAESLPVAPVPEEDRVTSVWNDVVDHRCGDETTFCLAADTQRVAVEEGPSCCLPSPVVSFLLCALAVALVERSMVGAVT